MTFNINYVAMLWQEYLKKSIKDLLEIQLRYTWKQLRQKIFRTKKGTEEETTIVEHNKNSLESLKKLHPNDTQYDLQHGDIFDKIYKLYIDIKCSIQYIAGVKRYSLENFNPDQLLDHYYLCINLVKREFIIVEHLYLYNLVKANKIRYQTKYDPNIKQNVDFIGERVFNQILHDPTLYDNTKIKKVKF